MGTGRRRQRRGLVGVLVLVLLAALGGAEGPPGERRAARDAVQQLLDRQAAAVRAGDASGYLARIDPAAARYRGAQRRVFRNLRMLPLAAWSYEVLGVRLDGDRARSEVRLSHRLRGYDRAPVTTVEKLDLIRRDGRWYVAGERAGSPRQLWEQGRLTVLRGRHSLVLGAGADRAVLQDVARAADRAVPAVSPDWPWKWPERVVVAVPGSVRAMGALLGASADAYEGIAAVTTSQRNEERRSGPRFPADGGPDGRRKVPADRIVVNPEAYGLLSDTGRQVVMTHETTHVATRAATSKATPLWLSEGLADWFGYRGSGRTPRQAAPELTRAVYQGLAPRTLPSDDDFRFESAPGTLSRAYESGWLACRMIAENWGEERLMALYLAIGRHDERRPGTVDRALRKVLGIGERELRTRWHAYVRTELAS